MFLCYLFGKETKNSSYVLIVRKLREAGEICMRSFIICTLLHTEETEI
jgi:hypothetical protein